MKKYILKVFSLVLTVVMGMNSFGAAFAAEEIPEGYTPIYTAEDLNNIRNNLSGKYILMNDIDLSVYENWEPIGMELSPFKGELNGNDKSINDLSTTEIVESNNRISSGLFAFTSGATIKNLSMNNADVKISETADHFYCVGIIAGNAKYSIIENCISSGMLSANVNGTCSAGGIAGEITTDSNIKNCDSFVNIFADGKSEIYIGGVIGSAASTVSLCSNKGDITVDNLNSQDKEQDMICVGGICGTMFVSDIVNCYNTGNIVMNVNSSTARVGGIGGNTYSVSDCYNIGEIVYSNQEATESTAGIAGNVVYFFNGMGFSENNYSYVSDCYCLDNIPRVLGNTDSSKVTNTRIYSEEEMKVKSNYEGYDFDKIWTMAENGYPEFRTETESQKPETVYNVKNAEIVYVPLKNRIVFGTGDPAMPNGIIIKLTYSDGTSKIAAVKKNSEEYHIEGESIECSGRISLVQYGLLTTAIYLNDGQIKMEYKYLVIPPIFTIIKNILMS